MCICWLLHNMKKVLQEWDMETNTSFNASYISYALYELVENGRISIS